MPRMASEPRPEDFDLASIGPIASEREFADDFGDDDFDEDDLDDDELDDDDDDDDVDIDEDDDDDDDEL